MSNHSMLNGKLLRGDDVPFKGLCACRVGSGFAMMMVAIITLLAGCADDPVTDAAPQRRAAPFPLLSNQQPISPPVLQDAVSPRAYSPAEAQMLERRSGYWVDHSVRSLAANARVRTLVIHYTGGDDGAAIRALTGEHVGVHYLIPEQTGTYANQPVILQLADEQLRAWHAGVSAWKGRDNLNDTSIGIEIVNPGFTRTATGVVWHPFSAS